MDGRAGALGLHYRSMNAPIESRPKSTWVTFVSIVVASLVVTLGGRWWKSYREREQLIEMIPAHPELSRDDRLRLAQAIEQNMGALLRQPDMPTQMSRALQRPVQTPAEVRAAARELSARGVTRFSSARLDELFSIRFDLAQRSPAVCAGMWTGRIADGEVMAALAKLPNDRMLRWFALSVEGMQLAMGPGFSTPPEDGDALTQMIVRARDALPDADRARFVRVIEQGERAAPLEGCATLLDLYRVARAAEPEARERFYRAMARN